VAEFLDDRCIATAPTSPALRDRASGDDRRRVEAFGWFAGRNAIVGSATK
jgi:hypothetical protein